MEETVAIGGGAATESFFCANTPDSDAERKIIRNWNYICKKEVEADIRWKKIVQNDVENLFVGLAVFWVSLIVCEYSESRLALIIFIVVFTFFRILHTFFFAYKMQAPRSISYLIACLCVTGAGCTSVIDAFRIIDYVNKLNAVIDS